MFQTILIVLGIFIFLLIVVVMLAFNFVMQVVKRFRDAMMNPSEDASNRHNRNYTGRRQQQYSFGWGRSHHQANKDSAQQGGASRRTRTATGETIIDNRGMEETNRKIFADDEGEYVDYQEEK
jgi:hypothetical protein